MTATSASWKRLPPPAEREDLGLAALFTDADAEQMMRGVIPHQMEDKWFVYFESGWLFFHRSWTGALIYALRLDGSPAGVRVVESWVNRNPQQYSGTDTEYDRRLVRFLIDALLLRKPDVRFPMRGGREDALKGVVSITTSAQPIRSRRVRGRRMTPDEQLRHTVQRRCTSAASASLHSAHAAARWTAGQAAAALRAMRHRICAAALMLLAFPIAAQSYSSALPSGKRFVMALANGAELFQQCSRDAPRGVTDFWAPTEAALDQLEADLIEELDARTGGLGARNGEQPPRGFAYHRQYVGFVKDGTRYIYGNFYPGADLFRYEDTRAVTVCDGGPAFWGVVYSPELRRFREFAFNGIT